MTFCYVFSVAFECGFTIITNFSHTAKLKNNHKHDKILIIFFIFGVKYCNYDWTKFKSIT